MIVIVLLYLDGGLGVNFHMNSYINGMRTLDLTRNNFQFDYFGHAFVLQFKPYFRFVSLTSISYMWIEIICYKNLKFDINQILACHIPKLCPPWVLWRVAMHCIIHC